ncbi:hypothetical protein [Staphylococcus argenteus]|uniref:hypothetical protein n=1 Tax=Staphylococcus argenteus TaxID=985002 RepID=UPI000F82B7E7|nr:hypothetical protein [Staphylococcus argenteus]
MTRLEELNKEFDLNIDEITVKENKKINLNKRKLIPITTIEKRDFNSMLPTLVSDDCLALRLDIAKDCIATVIDFVLSSLMLCFLIS